MGPIKAQHIPLLKTWFFNLKYLVFLSKFEFRIKKKLDFLIKIKDFSIKIPGFLIKKLWKYYSMEILELQDYVTNDFHKYFL